MTVKAEFGEVELPTDPQAALGMYTTDVDILITLGYPFAKSQPIRGNSDYTTFPSYFPQAELAGVTPFANYPDLNYEKILAAHEALRFDRIMLQFGVGVIEHREMLKAIEILGTGVIPEVRRGLSKSA